MHIGIDLYSPEHMRAFAEFLQRMAAADEADASWRRPLSAPPKPDLHAGVVPALHDSKATPDAALAVSEMTTDASLPAAEPEKPKRGRKPKADTAPAPAEQNISASPEDRQDPEVADEPQDAADEVAEEAAGKEDPGSFTRDELRDAMMDYAQRYGMEAVQADGPKILVGVAGVEKLSLVPDDKMGAAVVAFREAVAKNPYGRKTED